jgi:hypothetical protein
MEVTNGRCSGVREAGGVGAVSPGTAGEWERGAVTADGGVTGASIGVGVYGNGGQ